MANKKINDGLNKWQRYRLKDLEGYKKRKKEYAKSPEERKKRTEYMRSWRMNNREKHNKQSAESQARNKHKHINRIRNTHLLKKYGITLEQKVSMIKSQNSKCAICDKEFESTRSTHVDHCHTTGKVRGILCNVCNTKLGWYEAYKAAIENYMINFN
jgi:hypothetical protein